MKKIYLSLLAIAAFSSASAQNFNGTAVSGELTTFERGLKNNNGPTFVAKTSTANVIVQDTLWYFVNKHNYRNTSTNAGSFYTYKNASTYTSNVINSGGAIFLNTGNVVVSGAEGIVIRQASSPSPNVPVTFYLFNVSAGFPTGAAVASCSSAIASSTIGNYIGCNFSSPALVTGDYAIVMKNTSSNVLDTIRMFMNNARTPTAAISPAAPEMKYGESFGIFSFGATFGTSWDNTTDIFNLGAGNTGSDFEFCVAPRVTYTVTANNTASTYSTCNTAGVTYINTSSSFFSHRQYNLNKFFKSWAPFANTTALATEVIDSVFTWNFSDATTSNAQAPTHNYLFVSNTVSNDQMIAKLQKMSDYSSPNVTSDFKAWSVTVTICNVGLTENNIANQFAVYPNPATDKVTVMLNNANTNTQIQVLNALGQVVLTRTNLSEKNELNTESLSKGVYFVRVINGKESSTSKLIINK